MSYIEQSDTSSDSDNEQAASNQSGWNFVIQPDEIHCERRLGIGSFGAVYRGKCRGLEVAVKVLHNQELEEENLENFAKEIEIMSGLRHPNVVLFLGASLIPGKFMIVTELIQGGDLATYLFDQKVELSLFQRMKMGLEVARGMCWLHEMEPKLLHRDLKPTNILIDTETFVVKLCDFGLSTVKKGNEVIRSERPIGSPIWMAPEVIVDKHYTEKSDVYSFAIILWQLLTRTEPYLHIEDKVSLYKAITEHDERPPIPPDAPERLKNLLQSSWSKDPSKRPSFKQVLNILEHLVVDCAITDTIGNSFWKNEFLTKYHVKWPVFWKKFSEMFSPSESSSEENQQCLYRLLGLYQFKDPANAKVNIETFGKLLEWFPLGHDPLHPPTTSFMHKVRFLCSQPYFFGDLSTPDASNLLATQPYGVFLIRFSSSSPGSYALSRVDPEKKIVHSRIVKETDKFCFDGKSYKSITSFVDAMHHVLKVPCPGSPFASVFVKRANYGYSERI